MADQEQEWCGVCAKNGKTSKLKVYQINFDEAIRFCEDEKCTYPLGLDQPSGIIVSRKYTEISNKSEEVCTTTKSKIKSKAVGMKKQMPASSLVSGKKVLSPYVPGQTKNMQIQKNHVSSMSPVLGAVGNNPVNTVAKSNTNHITGVSYSPTVPKAENNVPNVFNKERTTKTEMLFPQWQNKDALCWLDVIMCLLVHSRNMQELKQRDDGDVITTLIKAYNQAVLLLNKTKTLADVPLTSCVNEQAREMAFGEEGHGVSSSGVAKDVENHFLSETVNKDLKCLSLQDDKVKTGAGLQLLKTDFWPLVAKHGSTDTAKAFSILGEVRETIWHMLHPRLKCQKGQNDSPVFAIPLLAKHSRDMQELLLVSYCMKLKCNKCGHEKEDFHEKVLPTLPNVPLDFSMKEPGFVRSCFKCEAPSQKMKMVFKRLSSVLMLHFVEGLPHCHFTDLDFQHDGVLYRVNGFVQYKNNPDHFVAWIRDPDGDMWMECNDLKSPLCQFTSKTPNIPANQIHIVMWESTGLDSNTCLPSKADVQSIQPGAMDTSDNGELLQSSVQNGQSSKPLANGQNLVTGNIVNISVPVNGKKKVLIPDNNTASSPVMPNSNNISNFTVSFLPSGHLMVPAGTKLVQVGAFKANKLLSGPKGLNTLVSKGCSANGTPSATSTSTSKEKVSLKGDCAKGNILKSRGKGGKPVVSSNGSSASTSHASSITLLRNLTAYRSKSNSSMSSQMNGGASTSAGFQAQGVSKPVNTDCKGILAKILAGRASIPQTVKPCAKTRVFAGYRPKLPGDVNSGDSLHNNSRSSTVSPTSEMLQSESRPVSPACSTHSDTVVVQKRKMDVAMGGYLANSVNKQKRRKSQDLTQNKLFRSKSISGPYSRIENLVAKRNAMAPSIESGSEGVGGVKGSSGTGTPECEILQQLYSSLNLALPSNDVHSEKNSTSESNVHDTMEFDLEKMPDISDLDKFIYGGNQQNSGDSNVENFLSQL